jgi:hypothetical protein
MSVKFDVFFLKNGEFGVFLKEKQITRNRLRKRIKKQKKGEKNNEAK